MNSIVLKDELEAKLDEVKAVAEAAKVAAEQAEITASGVNKIAPGYSSYSLVTLSAYKSVPKDTEVVLFDYSDIMFTDCYDTNGRHPYVYLEIYGIVNASLTELILQVNDTSHRLNMNQNSTVLTLPLGVKYYKLKLTVKNKAPTNYGVYLRKFASFMTSCISY